MPLQFRKRIKVLPGVHLNLGKRGMSVSVGNKFSRVTFGNGRTTQSVNLPGTGIGWRSTSGRGAAAAAAAPVPARPSLMRAALIGLLIWLLAQGVLMAALTALAPVLGLQDGLVGFLMLPATFGAAWLGWMAARRYWRKGSATDSSGEPR